MEKRDGRTERTDDLNAISGGADAYPESRSGGQAQGGSALDADGAQGDRRLTPEEIAGLSFETALERLESVVRRLEAGDVPLELAIELYQEGIRLARRCDDLLKNVEQKITLVVEEAPGVLAERPFGGIER